MRSAKLFPMRRAAWIVAALAAPLQAAPPVPASLAALPPASGAPEASAPAMSPVPAAPAAATPRPPRRATTGGSPCGRVEMGPIVKVAVGKSTLLRPRAPVTRILLGNPENSQAGRPMEGALAEAIQASTGGAQQNNRRPGVADVDVLLLSPSEIYLLGKTVGSTNLVLLDRAGHCTVVDVAVGMDTATLTATLRELLPKESSIKVSSAAESLILSGSVSDAAAADRAVDLATAFVRRGGGGQGGRAGAHDQVINMMSVAAPQQVMLEVKVAEISKVLLDKLGGRVSLSRSRGDWVYSLLGDFGRTDTSGFGGAFKSKNGTLIEFDAQRDNGLIKVLAEPTVMAISGQEGSFLAGGKIFIPVAQTNNNGGGTTVTLEEKEFGISLKFTPTVLGDGRINLKVSPEVSELNAQGVGVSVPGLSGVAVLPSFTTRRAATTVQLADGQSFAIGGLVKNNVTTNIKAFPVLGEIPILGALFRSSDFQTDRSELVIVVTPRLVKPLPPDFALPTDNYTPPNRADFLLNGKMEGPPREPSLPAPPAGPPAEQSNAAPPAERPAQPKDGGFELK